MPRSERHDRVTREGRVVREDRGGAMGRDREGGEGSIAGLTPMFLAGRLNAHFNGFIFGVGISRVS